MVLQMESRTQSAVKRYLETQRQLCTERARIATESYKSTEAEPSIIRAAKALEAVLKGISVWILDDELLVGHWASVPRGVPVWPEFGSGPPQLGFGLPRSSRQTLSHLRPLPAESTQQEMEKLTSYWKGKNPTDRIVASLPDHINAAREASLWYWYLGVVGNRRGRYLVDLPTVLGKGFNGIKKEAKEKLEEIDLEEPGAIRKQLFY
mgnify:CR=1 FL=1